MDAMLVANGDIPYFLPSLAILLKENTNLLEIIEKARQWSNQANLRKQIAYRDQLLSYKSLLETAKESNINGVDPSDVEDLISDSASQIDKTDEEIAQITKTLKKEIEEKDPFNKKK